MYPTATIPERIADGCMHVLGIALAIFGTIYLLGIPTSATLQLGMLVYGFALIAAFGASAIYNMMPYDGPRPMLRRIDHAMIYVLIAGTYTPLVVMIGTTLAYVILAIVWSLALLGITLKLFFWQSPGKFGPALYLIMGWLSTILIYKLVGNAPTAMIQLIAAGGLTYTLGVPIYATKRLPFSTAIWHGFVVAATACFVAAIAIGASTAWPS